MADLSTEEVEQTDSSKSFADLESDYHALKSEKDVLETALKRERFGWLVAVLFLLDVFFFEQVSAVAAVCLLILQLLFLLFAAEQSGVRSVFDLVKDASRAAAGLSPAVKGDEKDEKKGDPDFSAPNPESGKAEEKS